jgi:hypothetical protein
MYDPPYGLWSIWRELPSLYRLLAVTLFIVASYTVVSAALIVKGLKAAANLRKESVESNQRIIARLQTRCASISQILSAAFYLFGTLLSIGLQRAPITFDDGKAYPIFEILDNFILHFAFAANMFFLFLILHVVQWVLSSRLQAYKQRLGFLA